MYAEECTRALVCMMPVCMMGVYDGCVYDACKRFLLFAGVFCEGVNVYCDSCSWMLL